MQIYFGGHLDFYHPEQGRWMQISLECPTLLSSLLNNLGVPRHEVHLAVVGDKQVDPYMTLVTDDDVVRLFPAVDGG